VCSGDNIVVFAKICRESWRNVGVVVFVSPPFLNPDCPQSWKRSSLCSEMSSSGSTISVSSSSIRRCCETSSKCSSGGNLIDFRAKYGMTRNAAIGRSNKEPSSSARI
jgi:hypothetical protein